MQAIGAGVLGMRDVLARPGGGGGPPWQTDATSGIAVPASSAEWTRFLAAHQPALVNWSVPDHLYLCQENGTSQTNLADSIGAITLVANGGPNYLQPIGGWSRVGVQGSQVNAQGFSASGFPNVNTNSVFGYCIMASGVYDGSARSCFYAGSSPTPAGVSAFFSGGKDVLQVQSGSVYNSTGTYNSNGAIIGMLHDRTNANRDGLFTQLERGLCVSSAAPSSTQLTLLAGLSASAARATIGYSVWWYGAHAERSNADIKALYTALGYTIPWS